MSAQQSQMITSTVSNRTTVHASLMIILVGALSSLLLFTSNIYLVLAFLGLALSVFAFVNIKAAIWIILLNVFLTSSMVGDYFPAIGSKAIYLTDLMLLIILIRLAIFIAFEKIGFLKECDNLVILALIGLGIVSLVVAGAGVTVAVCGLRNYFKYIPLFLAFKYLINDEAFLKKLFRFWIIIAVINVPLGIYQLIAGPAVESMTRYDLVGGVFAAGGSGILSAYQLVIIGYILMIARSRPALSVWRTVFFVLFLMIPIFINETKVSFILIPLTFLYVFRKEVIRRPLEAFAMTVLAFALVFALNAVYQRPDQDFGGQQLFSKKWLNNYLYDSSYFSDDAALNRFSAVEFAWDNIRKDPIQFLIGVGPGNASFSQFPGGLGNYYEKYSELHIDMVFFSRILWEYGLVGTSLYFFLIFFLWRSSRVRRRSEYDPDRAIGADAFALLTGFLILTIVYNLSFYVDEFAFMFWAMSGIFRHQPSPHAIAA